ncbi:alpha-xylosidase [Microbacterium betulae]|uniref:alpha-D-xyloside xylohydrolase n=1 Tax=Microbacterium betulae TaxID=2981139 RepID=A0AA97I7G5_9MICO|nr:alpha-xylosidase [Microbacterium sp. AB]WOF24237.1 alpha-xylosidase [Microbacterium sp. AB]
MKFTDGFWQLRPGVEALYGREAYDVWAEGRELKAIVPTKAVERRGDTLNRPTLTVTLHSPLPGIVGVRVEHHQGGRREVSFDLVGAEGGHGDVVIDDERATLTSGRLRATITRGAPWSLVFTDLETGRVLTSSGEKSLGYLRVAGDARIEPGPVGSGARGGAYVHEQLSLGVGELIYGLGERFGPLVKNGQSIDVWNADGGTSSEQAYKNVPFYLSDRGYGVLVDHPGLVSYEVASENVERVQFSVAGESLEYHVVAGGSPAGVLERYTALTGRPARLPAWSYGLWLSTSFTTDYDEETVMRFIEGMAERDIPLGTFHFDCFWMREFAWCDFTWDPRVFPDPEGLLARLHDRGLRVCVWINPYIGQRSPLFAEGKEHGYFVTRPDGSVWQWDMWQAGMALVDFTNPEATAWYQGHLRRLVGQGVDCFKTDFGERIPLEVDYFDGSSPERMHNLYTQRYNEAVFEVLQEERGEGEAVLFARSATAGGQRMPVHWGGDNTSSFASMAESLRGGLSLSLSGFGFWSHDIGGFEGMPDPAVFKRWVAFGLLSSHSRLHGSTSYRVPWLFDEAEGRDESDPQSAVSVTRRFTRLKLSLLPYLLAAGLEAHRTGIPVMRPMPLAFPDDPAAAYLDRQYLLGPDLLVAPVFSAEGEVELYLPEGEWTSLLTGETVGGGWRRERHAFDSVPLYARPGAVIPVRARDDGTEYDDLDGLTLRVAPGGGDGERDLDVTTAGGRTARFRVERAGGSVRISSADVAEFSAGRIGGETTAAAGGVVELEV